MSEPLLRIQHLNRSFGALPVTDNVNFELRRGARHALIGPNGAGKTTLVNLITGVLKPNSGHIWLDQHNITALSEAQRAKLGLVRTFQINQLFRGLSVLENVVLAIAERLGISGRLWRPLSDYAEAIDEAMALLSSFHLADQASQPVHSLSYGQQRLVEIVIALGQRPRVLLLDEPAAGVPTAESRVILDAIDRLDEQLSLLIIEHDMDIVFRFAEQITVLVSGAILTSGTPQAIAENPQVRALYLGERNHSE